MRIAVFANSFPLLSETFILNQVTGFMRLGHSVDIYAHSVHTQPLVHPEVHEFALLERTFAHGHATMPSEPTVRLARAVRLLIDRRASPMPLLRSLNPFRYGRNALNLNRFYSVHGLLEKGSTYDVIHCHFGPNGVLGAFLKEVGALPGKLVTTFHGYDIAKRVHSSSGLYGHLFSTGDLFLPISERWRRELVRMGCPEERIRVHRMGIELSKFPFRPRHPGADGKLRLLTVARLVEKKGVEFAVRAVARMAGQNPRIEYLVAGDGPLREPLERLVAELGAGQVVRLLGWQPQDAVVRLMEEADAFLLPSVTDSEGDQEGIPVVLMEAMAQGLPVISTVHSGIPELVQDGRTGFLVPERDVDGLCVRMRQLMEHPILCEEMGRQGREHIERHYDVDRLNAQLAELFESMIRNR